MEKICPCRDCAVRKPGCHGSCAAYLEWQAEHRKLREYVSGVNRIYSGLIGATVSRMDRNRKKRRGG